LEPAPAMHPGPHRHKAPTAQASRDAQTQRDGIASPQAEGDREWFAFISVPNSFVGGVPMTRARNPWVLPEASV